MKYSNGREAKVGDRVLARASDGSLMTAVVRDIAAEPPKAGGPDAQVSIVALPTNQAVVLGQCIHADDAAAALAAKPSTPAKP